MACPYFYPTRRLEAAEWRSKIRPPLGDAHEGECHAHRDNVHTPAREMMLDACNLGYPSRHCCCFPEQSGPDAVRFGIHKDSDGVIEVDYVLERGYLPFENGVMVYDRKLQQWSGVAVGSLLQVQAQAFLESYLVWKKSERRQVRVESRPVKLKTKARRAAGKA